MQSLINGQTCNNDQVSGGGKGKKQDKLCTNNLIISIEIDY